MIFNNKVLILGGSGFVGRHLSEALGPDKSLATYNNGYVSGGVYFNSLTMKLADIVDDPSKFSHAVILLGDTKPDSCAENIELSQALNVDSIKSILTELKEWGVKPVFTSTEVIFDGSKGNYVESDEVNPILTYGKQKVAIEKHLSQTFDDYLIMRLALIYGSERQDGTILSAWLDSIEKGITSSCAYDYVCSPIYIDDVVQSFISLIDVNAQGIIHVAGSKPYSRLEIYQILLDQVKEIYPVDLDPISCSMHDFNLRERRPLNVSMKPDKLLSTTGIVIRELTDVCGLLAKQAFQTQLSG